MVLTDGGRACCKSEKNDISSDQVPYTCTYPDSRICMAGKRWRRKIVRIQCVEWVQERIVE